MRGKWWEGCLDVVADGIGDWREHLGVKHYRRWLVCQFGKDFFDVRRGDRREFFDTTLDEEAFEAADAFADEGSELGGVAGDDAAIEANVDPALALGCLDLCVEVGNCGCWWDCIQRHVNDCCYASEGCSLSAGVEAFPFRPAWFVEVDMCIN